MGGTAVGPRWFGVAAAVALVSLFSAPVANATSPGQNGAIAFETPPLGQVSSVSPTGMGIRSNDQVGLSRSMKFFGSGSQVVYVHNSSELWIANFPGWKNPREILSSSAGWGCCAIRSVVPSADGKQFYFSAGLGDEPTESLWKYSLQDRSLTKLGSWSTLGLTPAISPDGSTLAVVISSGGPNTILLMQTDGTHQRMLETPFQAAYDPSFSPDGKRIVFSDYSGEFYPKLGIKSIDSDDPPVAIDTGINLSASRPIFSPDGKQVAFMGEGESLLPNVYAIRLADEKVTRLTTANVEQMPTDWQRKSPFQVGTWNSRTRSFSVRTYAPAKIRVSGPKLRAMFVSSSGDQTRKVRLGLVPKARAELRRRGKLKLKIRVVVKYPGESWTGKVLQRTALFE